MSIENETSTKGLWRPTKVPVAYQYSIEFRCGVCEKGETLSGIADNTGEGIGHVDVGLWRRIQNPAGGQHANPFEELALIVCSPDCADRAYRSAMSEIYPTA